MTSSRRRGRVKIRRIRQKAERHEASSSAASTRALCGGAEAMDGTGSAEAIGEGQHPRPPLIPAYNSLIF